jgi:hypothetical protein
MMLAHIVGADVRADAADQRHHTQADGQHHALLQAAVAVQAIVDGGKQRGDAQAAEHAQQGGDGHRRPERAQQPQQLAQRG